MDIRTVIDFLDKIAPPALQESYDNAGLITGDITTACSGVLLALDVTEAVIEEALQQNCNLVVAHHPIIFKGLKRLVGKSYVERTVIKAIKHDIAIYAIHTNLDNEPDGVNGKIAERLGLQDCKILTPKAGLLKKLVVFVPVSHKEQVMQAIFSAGAGQIGRYSECSFTAEGMGSFKAGAGAQPFVGKQGERHYEKELRLEVVLPHWLAAQVILAMIAAHPYEEVAYDIYSLDNLHKDAGSGMVGNLSHAMDEKDLLQQMKDLFGCTVLKHTALLNKPVKRVALCGGAGIFLLPMAMAAGADIYITSDVKYHEFFDAEGRILLTDIGHWESEQFTVDLLFDRLRENFPKFAVLKTDVVTNPVQYF